MVYDKPKNDLAEITLIGTGGGYGESCVIHYGNDMWAVVDSCENPNSKECLPLSYLRKIGVDVNNDVKLIVCTHWHNDHILGLSKLFSECGNAILCYGKANDRKKFLTLVALDYQKIKDEASLSSTTEFVACLKIARERKLQVKNAIADRLLIKDDKIPASITSLSPSDFVIEQFDSEISTLIKDYGSPEKKIVLQHPNDKSVVLLLEIGCHKILLGADLEVSSDNRKGWLDIIDHSEAVRNKKSTLFKIPHHGSENGFHDRIWLELLEINPIGKLTPWNRNQGLPESEMVKKYLEKSQSLFITSPIILNKKPKDRDRSTKKLIEFFNKKVFEVKYKMGIIRSRIELDNASATWQVSYDGEAFEIPKVA
ncbi:MAG TPA: MBL fold metallo-hydrolase [Puia sp.]|jgi:hypothetical protein|nr:MBL fold metallo-hydrolase [Puia sp.]